MSLFCTCSTRIPPPIADRVNLPTLLHTYPANLRLIETEYQLGNKTEIEIKIKKVHFTVKLRKL